MIRSAPCRMLKYALLLPNVLPGLVALGITTFYFEAKEVLGHFPRPSIDDPKNLSNWDDFSFLWEWLLFSYLVLLVGPPVSVLVGRWLTSEDRRLIATVMSINWAVYLALHFVPGINVLEWYLD